jgi:hypothetical protein
LVARLSLSCLDACSMHYACKIEMTGWSWLGSDEPVGSGFLQVVQVHVVRPPFFSSSKRNSKQKCLASSSFSPLLLLQGDVQRQLAWVPLKPRKVQFINDISITNDFLFSFWKKGECFPCFLSKKQTHTNVWSLPCTPSSQYICHFRFPRNNFDKIYIKKY